jgi:hypothetical protein
MNNMAWIDGNSRCVGLLLRRGRLGSEAFEADEKSLGLFPSESRAAEVVLGKLEKPAGA